MYYAVKCGRNPGIYSNWSECKEQVFKFSGAVYKKFGDKRKAEEFMELEGNNEGLDLTKGPVFYVDGSFTQGNVGCGICYVHDDEEKTSGYWKSEHTEYYPSRNILGELESALMAIVSGIEMGLDKIVIVHDYSGIRKFATGEWSASSPVAKWYKANYIRITGDKDLEILFYKVKGHTGVKWNERVDDLAKEGCKC